MILARVTGTVVATVKHPDYEGKKVLMVQPVTPELEPVGSQYLAVDAVQAGEGDVVMVANEGGGARLILNDDSLAAVRCTIAGIVDQVNIQWPIRTA